MGFFIFCQVLVVIFYWSFEKTLILLKAASPRLQGLAVWQKREKPLWINSSPVSVSFYIPTNNQRELSCIDMLSEMFDNKHWTICRYLYLYSTPIVQYLRDFQI